MYGLSSPEREQRAVKRLAWRSVGATEADRLNIFSFAVLPGSRQSPSRLQPLRQSVCAPVRGQGNDPQGRDERLLGRPHHGDDTGDLEPRDLQGETWMEANFTACLLLSLGVTAWNLNLRSTPGFRCLAAISIACTLLTSSFSVLRRVTNPKRSDD